jgi:hypothetical protein
LPKPSKNLRNKTYPTFKNDKTMPWRLMIKMIERMMMLKMLNDDRLSLARGIDRVELKGIPNQRNHNIIIIIILIFISIRDQQDTSNAEKGHTNFFVLEKHFPYV